MPTEIVVDRKRPPGLIIRLLINAVALYLTAELIDGVEVTGFWGAALGAVVITAVNAIVKPILVVLTLPITCLTLGLFYLVVNGLSLLLAAAIAGRALEVRGIGPAILAAFVLAVLNWAITAVFKRERVTVVRR
jgi:putative membrane protein